jgi:basic membrane protein A
LYEAGADIVYVAAGRTGLGAIRAAQDRGRPVITTSVDQRWIAPEVVVTSRLKNLDKAVLMLVRELRADTLKSEIWTLDLRSRGVDLAPLTDERIPATVRQRMEDLRGKLLDGVIRVREYQIP